MINDMLILPFWQGNVIQGLERQGKEGGFVGNKRGGEEDKGSCGAQQR